MSTTKRPTPNWQDPIHLLAFGLGSGAAPVAPGTFGTLAAVPLYLVLQPLGLPLYLLSLLLVFVIGIAICEKTSRDLGVHDHPGIVWDEIAGYLVTMAGAPFGWYWMVTGFLLFRGFDIFKPWPIGWADRRVTGGLGIMLDDCLAGVYAWLCLQGLVWATAGL